MAGLAKAVRSGEALREEADEAGGGEADDVEVVPFDPIDERRAEALNRVPARPTLTLPGRDVSRHVPRCQRTKADARHGVLDLLPPRSDEAEAGHHLVRLARKSLEHRRGRLRPGRLPVHLAAEHDGGVDAEHRPISRPLRDRTSLAGRVRPHEFDRPSTGQIAFLIPRSDHLERNPELLEDRSPLRARGG